jgi:uncharacterized OsmC-like protein
MAALRSAFSRQAKTEPISRVRVRREKRRDAKEDTMATVKPRRTGATAVITPTGQAVVTSATGGEIGLNRAATDPAFSPLDLLYAAVAGCLVVSLRDAARRIGVIDRLRLGRAVVQGEKAPEGPPRVARLRIKFEIDGDFDDATRAALIAEAEETCTVSNTLREAPEFVTAD